MVPDARKDALAHPANNPRAVAHALVDAELDVLLAQKQRAAAEEGGGGLGGDARARGALREQQRDGLGGE